MLDQPEFLEHPTDDSVAQFRYAASQVLHRQPWRQHARALDLHPVVEDGDPDRRTALRVVRMHHGIDDSFAQRHGREAPGVGPTHSADVESVQAMFPDKLDGSFYDGRQRAVQCGGIDKARLVGAFESTGLDPGISLQIDFI